MSPTGTTQSSLLLPTYPPREPEPTNSHLDWRWLTDCYFCPVDVDVDVDVPYSVSWSQVDGRRFRLLELALQMAAPACSSGLKLSSVFVCLRDHASNPSTPSSTIAVQGRPRTNGAPDHADFLRRVAGRHTNSNITMRPTPLSAKEHATPRKQLKRVQYIKRKYAAETEINVPAFPGNGGGPWQSAATRRRGLSAKRTPPERQSPSATTYSPARTYQRSYPSRKEGWP
ncbi:hypothetical protein BJ170DRAFT_93813 [Xylariales sp. AK1849]|nr:hypothetical protein BJ170DRAFT_93813 [Xylariales sp. AK1849]